MPSSSGDIALREVECEALAGEVVASGTPFEGKEGVPDAREEIGNQIIQSLFACCGELILGDYLGHVFRREKLDVALDYEVVIPWDCESILTPMYMAKRWMGDL